MKQNRIALGGLLTALGVVILFLSSALPVMKAGMAAIAGVVTAIAVVRLGIGGGIFTWIATSVLALLLLPVKSAALLFALFFGPYALVKNQVERHLHGKLQWIPKLLFCTVVSALLLQFSAQILELLPRAWAAMLPVAVVVIDLIFIVYDVVFSKLIAYFIVRIS